MMPGGTDVAPEKPQYRPPSGRSGTPGTTERRPPRNGLSRARVKFTRRPVCASPRFFSRSTAVASNTSKTARASVRAGQAGQGGALSVLGEYKYLIPLNKGKHAYVRNLTNGKTTHM